VPRFIEDHNIQHDKMRRHMQRQRWGILYWGGALCRGSKRQAEQ